MKKRDKKNKMSRGECILKQLKAVVLLIVNNESNKIERDNKNHLSLISLITSKITNMMV